MCSRQEQERYNNWEKERLEELGKGVRRDAQQERQGQDRCILSIGSGDCILHTVYCIVTTTAVPVQFLMGCRSTWTGSCLGPVPIKSRLGSRESVSIISLSPPRVHLYHEFIHLYWESVCLYQESLSLDVSTKSLSLFSQVRSSFLLFLLLFLFLPFLLVYFRLCFLSCVAVLSSSTHWFVMVRCLLSTTWHVPFWYVSCCSWSSCPGYAYQCYVRSRESALIPVWK